jgi:hypothetical protein
MPEETQEAATTPITIKGPPDRRHTQTPEGRLRVKFYTDDEDFYEIWLITHPLPVPDQPPRFLIALRRPEYPYATIFHISEDGNLPHGYVLRYDHGSQYANPRFATWNGVGIIKRRNMLNFFQTVLGVKPQTNNEWVLTMMCRLERYSFISDGKTEEWLRLCGQFDHYRSFWETLTAQHHRRYLHGMFHSGTGLSTRSRDLSSSIH